MWPVIYTTFCAAIASASASALLARLLKRKKKRHFVAIMLAAISGTVLVAIGIALPSYVAPLRRALRPESAIEGAWIQTSQDPAGRTRNATVRIRFNPTSSAFELIGRTYIVSEQNNQILVTERAEWRSLSMTVRPHAGNLEGVYSYAAEIKEGKFQNVDGFGKITFDCKKDGACNHGVGYYLDTQIKNPVNIELRRLRDDRDALFSSNPEELLRRYHKQPSDIILGDDKT